MWRTAVQLRGVRWKHLHDRSRTRGLSSPAARQRQKQKSAAAQEQQPTQVAKVAQARLAIRPAREELDRSGRRILSSDQLGPDRVHLRLQSHPQGLVVQVLVRARDFGPGHGAVQEVVGARKGRYLHAAVCAAKRWRGRGGEAAVERPLWRGERTSGKLSSQAFFIPLSSSPRQTNRPWVCRMCRCSAATCRGTPPNTPKVIIPQTRQKTIDNLRHLHHSVPRLERLAEDEPPMDEQHLHDRSRTERSAG